MNFDASELSGIRKVKVVDAKEPERLGQEWKDCPARRRRRLGSLGGEIVC